MTGMQELPRNAMCLTYSLSAKVMREGILQSGLLSVHKPACVVLRAGFDKESMRVPYSLSVYRAAIGLSWVSACLHACAANVAIMSCRIDGRLVTLYTAWSLASRGQDLRPVHAQGGVTLLHLATAHVWPLHMSLTHRGAKWP